KTLLTGFYKVFNKGFGWFTDVYVSITGLFVRKWLIGVVGMGAIVFLIVVIVKQIPGGFVPEEDQGYLLVNAQLPDAASLERTDLVMRKAEAVLKQNEGVEGYNT